MDLKGIGKTQKAVLKILRKGYQVVHYQDYNDFENIYYVDTPEGSEYGEITKQMFESLLKRNIIKKVKEWEPRLGVTQTLYLIAGGLEKQ